MSLPRWLLECDAMIYPTIFLYWQKTDLMIPKRDTKIAKSDIQGRINVTDYRISSLQMGYFSYILLTGGCSRGDKQHFPFSSQQLVAGGAYFYISIFHHNLVVREEFYLSWQGQEELHLTSSPELLQRFIFSSSRFLLLLWRKCWGKSQCQ